MKGVKPQVYSHGKSIRYRHFHRLVIQNEGPPSSTHVPAIATPPSLLLYPEFDPHRGQILLVGHEHVDSGSYHFAYPPQMSTGSMP